MSKQDLLEMARKANGRTILDTAMVEIAALREQVAKLANERGIERDTANRFASENCEMREQVAALASQNEKMRKTLLPSVRLAVGGYVPLTYEEAVQQREAISLPDLTSPVLNRIRADFAEELAQTVWMRAIEECKRRRQNPAEANDLFTACAVIRAKADELEKANG